MLAMSNLSANAFKLWVYMADNANGYPLILYSRDFEHKASVSQSTYTRVFKELEEKGYIIKSKNAKNFYLFKEKSDNIILNDSRNILNFEELNFEEIKDTYFENQN